MSVHDEVAIAEAKKVLGIPEDEPIFVLRAQDYCAAETIGQYRTIYRYLARDSESYSNGTLTEEEVTKYVHRIQERENEFNRWEEANQDTMKIPD